MNMRLFKALCLCTLTLGACTNSDDPDQGKAYGVDMPEVSTRVVESSNGFALRMLNSLLKNSPAENVALSPLSVNFALSMVANGDDGDGRDAVLRALDMPVGEDGLSELNRTNTLLLEYLPQLDSKVNISLANSFWHAADSRVREGFTTLISDVYQAGVFTQDITTDAGKDAVNSWIEGKTNGVIKDFLTMPFPSSSAFVNTTYFNGEWKDKFDKKSSHAKVFHNADGTETWTEFMNNDTEVSYYEGDGVKMVGIPYSLGKMTFYAIMPDSWEDYSKICDRSFLDELMESSNTGKVHVSVPKFHHKVKIQNLFDFCSGELGEIAKSKFTGIFEDSEYVFNFLTHGVDIEVDEKGTVAAAATVVWGDLSPGPMKEIQLDHPFIYVIMEESSKCVLFEGAVVKF